jgi:hypothetical protein
MATPVVLTTGARPIIPVESGGVPMTPVDTLGEPVTVVDTLGEPVVLINEDGTPAFLAYSAKTYLGGVAPYHWLDFINNRALYASVDVGNVTGATGYSFTRASDGYYTNADGTLTLFGSGALRRGDRGVLIEGSRTNLLTYSQQFDGVNWTTSRGTVTANASTAPDGTLTADRFVCNSTSALETGVRQATSQAVSTAHTVSVFAKYRSARYLVLRNIALTGTLAQECAYFDLLNGVVATRGAFVTTSTITALANGWYLCTATGTTAAVIPNNLVDIRTSDADGSFSNTSGTEVDLWQADLQAGAFPSSPIITVAAAATRAADVLTYTAGVTYPIQLWSEFERAVDTGGDEEILRVAFDGNERSSLSVRSTGDLARAIQRAGAADVADLTVGSALGLNVPHKMAARFALNSVRLACAGTLSTEDTVAALPTNPVTLTIGQSGTPFGYIRRIAVIQGAGTDANLVSMTT